MLITNYISQNKPIRLLNPPSSLYHPKITRLALLTVKTVSFVSPRIEERGLLITSKHAKLRHKSTCFPGIAMKTWRISSLEMLNYHFREGLVCTYIFVQANHIVSSKQVGTKKHLLAWTSTPRIYLFTNPLLQRLSHKEMVNLKPNISAHQVITSLGTLI